MDLHLAIASLGDWPNGALCGASKGGHVKRVLITRKLAKVTCIACREAWQQASMAAHARRN